MKKEELKKTLAEGLQKLTGEYEACTDVKAKRRINRRLVILRNIRNLIVNDEIDGEWIEGIINPRKAANKVVIKEGDDILVLLQQFPNTKNLYQKILKWCEANDCELKGSKIVKKSK